MKTLQEMEEYAKEHFVPIARKDFIEFLKSFILQNHYHDILEIGSAIGYSAIQLALLNDVYVTTIEQDDKRFAICLQNIYDFHLENKIQAIHDDALSVFISQKYDVIFIDAAKAKNILFFDKYKVNLRNNGIIIIDNMELKDFKKMVQPKKAKFYEEKINELKEYLASLVDFDVTYLDIGDGIALLKRK